MPVVGGKIASSTGIPRIRTLDFSRPPPPKKLGLPVDSARPEVFTMIDQVLLGKYRVLRLLDQGGMCLVYLARQLDNGREVVVKVLQEQLRSIPKPLEYFRREIHILSRFEHPHAVAYLDAAPNDRTNPLLVMEYLRGTDLGLILDRERRLAPERAGRLLVQLCDVLGAAHQAGIVHRDIKPGNLMILHAGTPHETLKLMDFGLAKMSSLLYLNADTLGDFSLPAAAGTPEYMCPEQIRSQDMDSRGDLYCAGVVLYEALAGRRPFERASTDALLRAHQEAEPPTFSQLGVLGVTPALEAVVRACLAKHPDQRPQTARELSQRLQMALGQRVDPPAQTASGSARTPVPESVPCAPSAPAATAADRHALRQQFEATMPEAMALLKIKGFLNDLGTEVLESMPGLIRMRLGPPPTPKKSGLFSLVELRERMSGGGTKSSVLQVATVTDLELRMERRDPTRPNHLTFTLLMRPGNGLPNVEWRNRCQKISMDLRAYLMGR
jgi:serine/threonine protein kinase